MIWETVSESLVLWPETLKSEFYQDEVDSSNGMLETMKKGLYCHFLVREANMASKTVQCLGSGSKCLLPSSTDAMIAYGTGHVGNIWPM